jgi:hypothetical protein
MFMLTITPTSRQPARQPWTYEWLVREWAVALGSILDPSTRTTYNSHLQSYLTFCKNHQFPITPTPDTLSFYVVYMSHHISPSSVVSYLSGICNRLQPFFPDVRTIRAHRLVTQTLTGCMKLYRAPIHRKRPLSVEDLLFVTTIFHAPSHDDKLFLALLYSAFFALHRLGELTVPDRVPARDWRKVIKRSSVTLYNLGYGYVLPYHKADRFFNSSTIIISHHDGADPVPVFTSYLASRDSLFRLRPALWLTSSGSLPTRAWFLRRLHTLFPADVSGHSLRSGGATFFAALGWPDERIQALGRWSSDAFKIYIRKNPVVLQALLYGRTILERDATLLPP